MSDEYKRALYLLLGVGVVILAAGMGLRDPWPADEPRFALIARDMAESGRWLFPNVGGVLYPDKPPLHFWMVAALYAATGSLRFSFLFPAFAQGIVMLVLIADLGRRLWGETAGIWSGAILLALLQFPLQMKSGQLDGPLCFWTTLSLYGFCRHLLLGPDWRWYAIGGLAAGLGIITKGVGILPYLVFIPLIIAVRGKWPLPAAPSGGWRWLLAPAMTLVAVAAWLGPMLLVSASSGDPALLAYRDNILFHQTVTRYANAWGHIKPPWYLWTNAMPWLWAPATLALPWLIPAWWRDLKAKRNTPLLILGGWVLLVLLFFSLSSGKRSVYIFPAAPVFALIVGAYAAQLAGRKSIRRVMLAFSVGLGLLLVAAGMYGLMNPHVLLDQIPDVVVIVKGMLIVVGMGVLMLFLGILVGRKRPFAGVAASIAVLWLGLGLLIAPAIDGIRSGRNLMEGVETRLSPDEDLALVGWPEQFLLHAGRPVYHFGFRRDVEGDVADSIVWLNEDPAHRVLVSSEDIEPCFSNVGRVEVGRAHRRTWWLVSRDSVRSECQHENVVREVHLYQRAGRH